MHQARVATHHYCISNLSQSCIQACAIAHPISHHRASKLALPLLVCSSAIAFLLSLQFVYFWVECDLVCACSWYLKWLCSEDLSFHFWLSFSLLTYLCLCRTFCNFGSRCPFVLLLDLFLCSVLLFAVFAIVDLFKIRKLENVWYRWPFWCFFFSFVTGVRSYE